MVFDGLAISCRVRLNKSDGGLAEEVAVRVSKGDYSVCLDIPISQVVKRMSRRLDLIVCERRVDESNQLSLSVSIVMKIDDRECKIWKMVCVESKSRSEKERKGRYRPVKVAHDLEAHDEE